MISDRNWSGQNLKMSTIVCGKRPFLEELSSPSVSKRARRNSSSPGHISPWSTSESIAIPSTSLLLDHLINHFPDIDKELLEKALGECGDNLDLAIKRLNELRFGCATNNVVADVGLSAGPTEVTNQAEVVNDQDGACSENPVAPTNLPEDGAEWLERFVQEMASTTNLDDARISAARALESLEKSICTRVSSQVTQNFQQENTLVKEQIRVMMHENTILRRAVSVQHERQKEFDDKSQELQHLRQLVSQYQEKVRTLEVNNYALLMHLKQSQQSSSMLVMVGVYIYCGVCGTIIVYLRRKRAAEKEPARPAISVSRALDLSYFNALLLVSTVAYSVSNH